MGTICMEEQMNEVIRQPIRQENIIFMPILKYFIKFQVKAGVENWETPHSAVSFIQPFPISFRDVVLAKAS